MSAQRLSALALLIIASLLLAACGAAGGGIAVKDAYARATPPEAMTTGAFATITNGGKAADRLISAASPAAKTVELHETVNEGGVMKMQPHPEGWEIPAGGKLELAPGGKHIMLIDLAAPLKAGETIELTLTFEKAGAIKIQAPVKAIMSGM